MLMLLKYTIISSVHTWKYKLNSEVLIFYVCVGSLRVQRISLIISRKRTRLNNQTLLVDHSNLKYISTRFTVIVDTRKLSRRHEFHEMRLAVNYQPYRLTT